VFQHVVELLGVELEALEEARRSRDDEQQFAHLATEKKSTNQRSAKTAQKTRAAVHTIRCTSSTDTVNRFAISKGLSSKRVPSNGIELFWVPRESEGQQNDVHLERWSLSTDPWTKSNLSISRAEIEAKAKCKGRVQNWRPSADPSTNFDGSVFYFLFYKSLEIDGR